MVSVFFMKRPMRKKLILLTSLLVLSNSSYSQLAKADFKIQGPVLDLCVSTEAWPLSTPPQFKTNISHKKIRAIHMAVSRDLELWAVSNVGAPVNPEVFLKTVARELKWIQKSKTLPLGVWSEFQGYETKQKRVEHHWQKKSGKHFASWSWILDNTNVAVVIQFTEKEKASAQTILEYFFKGHLSLSCEN
jgi:hypothetical protein